MGYTSYSYSDRSHRTVEYKKMADNDIFRQNALRRIHESMDPKTISIRECRDSDTHPNTLPVIITLDVTGSMGKIPSLLIKDGLPNMVKRLLDNGINDSSILFLAVGDHTVDKHPLQVGQFESGDLELDTWLSRTYLEGGGGGNEGESYLLSWYFALNHTVTDAFEKRGEKGILFTIGDEPNLKTLPSNVIRELTGKESQNWTSDELLEEVSKKWNVYHIHISHGVKSERASLSWKETLGDNCIVINDYKEVPNKISDVILNIGTVTNNLPVSIVNQDSFDLSGIKVELL
jgi:hypothetical protein